MIRLVLADDHPVIRAGIASILASEHDMEVVGEAGNLVELRELIAGTTPAVAVVDVAMDTDLAGIDAIGLIQERFPECRVLVLSMYRQGDVVRRAIAAGAAGYLLKSEATERIVDAIRTVASGGAVFPARTTELPPGNVGAPEGQPTEGIAQLTEREMSVFRLIGLGLTVRAISKRLAISTSTVGSHIENMKKKLDFKSSTELSRCAIEYALTTADPALSGGTDPAPPETRLR